MKALMISCLKATELTEKRLHFGLSISESVQWHLHTTMCSACRLYSKQSMIIEKALENTISQTSHSTRISDAEAQSLVNKILKK